MELKGARCKGFRDCRAFRVQGSEKEGRSREDNAPIGP